MKPIRVAILGAGIMGASTALYLSKLGADVTLFDSKHAPIDGASRWNEGKIHLGYLYNADPSLKTFHNISPGGLAFKPIVEELLDTSLSEATTQIDDLYLCHRNSVVNPDQMERYFQNVTSRLCANPEAKNYLADISDCRIEKLSARELGKIADTRLIAAGFRVPERSVMTLWVADRFASALSAEPGVQQVLQTRILGAQPLDPNEPEGCWSIDSTQGSHGPFDVVINALWEGRLAIDETAGLKLPARWSHRFRQALFVRTKAVVDIPSAVIATGPFGDVKNYNGRDFYLSWYPSGLICNSSAVLPPELSRIDKGDRAQSIEAVFSNLETIFPNVRKIEQQAEEIKVAGGWVYANRSGELSDPSATLHGRSEFGVEKLGSYYSINTGKYSTAPWLARQIAKMISEERRSDFSFLEEL